MSQAWLTWVKGLNQLTDFRVDRTIKPANYGHILTAQLHHFSDASEIGYGTVSCLRLTNVKGHVHCAFMVGKSRVAPLKQITMPRMELTAAVMAVNMDKVLRKELQLKLQDSTFWTDSTTVLRYIDNCTLRFKTFVANQISMIRDSTRPEQWRYINTKTNPADCASRGLSAAKFLNNENWILGPPILADPHLWPGRPDQLKIETDDFEVRKIVTANTIHATEYNDSVNKLFNNYSKWYKLKRAVAWILRVKETLKQSIRKRKETQAPSQIRTRQIVRLERERQYCKKALNKPQLTVDDLTNAEKEIIRICQEQHFQEEIPALKKGSQKVKRTSCVHNLDPILQDGVLRVGGRLCKSAMPLESKHPAILPKDSHVTQLILRDIHERVEHSGRSYMISQLRRTFWILRASSTIRRLLSECVVCRRVHAKGGQQKMADLPNDRLVPDKPPFTNVGVDYFGPFEVKTGRSTMKRYRVIFTCLTTRAVHLEIANTLDTDSCFNALRRYICRRGQVAVIRSDNGTNFVGAERVLRESIQPRNQAKIQNVLVQKGIQCIFNPPAASHFGGVWERQIRTVRKILNSVVKQQILEDECLHTLFCEVESIINDRPITKSSDDPNNLEPLTPNRL